MDFSLTNAGSYPKVTHETIRVQWNSRRALVGIYMKEDRTHILEVTLSTGVVKMNLVSNLKELMYIQTSIFDALEYKFKSLIS